MKNQHPLLYYCNFKHATAEADLDDALVNSFYDQGIVSQINNDQVIIVQGRKGSGKTALCKYIESLDNHSQFTSRLSFNEVFTEVNYEAFSRKAMTKSSPNSVPNNQYISIFRFIICLALIQQMIIDQKVDEKYKIPLKTFLEGNNYPMTSDHIPQFFKSIKKKGIIHIGPLKKVGFEFEKETIHYKECLTNLENFLCKIKDPDKIHNILFDQLDETYGHDPKYFEIILGLIKAVYHTFKKFRGSNVHIVVFIRNDIYSKLHDCDLSKIRDFLHELKWQKEELQELVLKRTDYFKDKSTDELWNQIFPDYIFPHSQNAMDAMWKRSFARPRDFLVFCRELQVALKEDLELTYKHFRKAEIEYSKYFKDDIESETFVEIPRIKIVFEVIRKMGVQRFNSREFYKFKSQFNSLKDLHERDILRSLYDFGIIGNIYEDANETVKLSFKFWDYTEINFDYDFVVHEALSSALSLKKVNRKREELKGIL